MAIYIDGVFISGTIDEYIERVEEAKKLYQRGYSALGTKVSPAANQLYNEWQIAKQQLEKAILTQEQNR